MRRTWDRGKRIQMTSLKSLLLKGRNVNPGIPSCQKCSYQLTPLHQPQLSPLLLSPSPPLLFLPLPPLPLLLLPLGWPLSIGTSLWQRTVRLDAWLGSYRPFRMLRSLLEYYTLLDTSFLLIQTYHS